MINLKNYGPENKRGYRYVLAIIENFSKFAWSIPLKNENARTIKDSFENIITSSKRKLNLFETDRVKEIYNILFQNSLIRNKIKFVLETHP